MGGRINKKARTSEGPEGIELLGPTQQAALELLLTFPDQWVRPTEHGMHVRSFKLLTNRRIAASEYRAGRGYLYQVFKINPEVYDAWKQSQENS